MIGYEKRHAFGHAQGGLEGGPNYFPQRAALNRCISDRGKLWRKIEIHLAVNAGLFAFVRLLCARNDTVTPVEVEYGFLNGPQQFRAVVFENQQGAEKGLIQRAMGDLQQYYANLPSS